MKIKKITRLFFAFLSALIIMNACNSDNNKRDANQGDTTRTADSLSNKQPVAESTPQTNKTTEKKFLITGNGIGQLKKDADIPSDYEVAPYQVVKEKREEMQEGSKYEISVSKLMKGTEPVAEIFNNEVWIFSDDFKTEKQIGVQSAVDEFIAAYPDATVWYTYISDRFIIETDEIPNTQFIIDKNGYTGAQEKLTQSDRVVLEPGEIKKDAKIMKIRYF